VKSCQALGIKTAGRTNSERLGIARENICGASKDNNGVCMLANTWRKADELCSANGMHLCTSTAILADATRGTGCQYDNHRVFTSSKCSTNDDGILDGYMVMRGRYPSYNAGPRCVKPNTVVNTDNWKVRCCSLSNQALTPGTSFLRFDVGGLTDSVGAADDVGDYDYEGVDYYDYSTERVHNNRQGNDNGTSIKAVNPDSSNAAAGGDNDGSSDNDKSLSGGAIVAIVIVVLLAVIVAAVVGAIVGRRMLRAEQPIETKAVPEIVVDSDESGNAPQDVRAARMSTPSIRTFSYSSALDEPTQQESTRLTEDNGFVLDKDGSLRLHSVRRENPAYRQSVYRSTNVVGSAGVDTNTSL